jgi:hypothetical protein
MRLTAFALFIALPAVSYGAVSPRQTDEPCGKLLENCGKNPVCCGALSCIGKLGVGVCLVAPFALICVGVGTELYAEMPLVTLRTRCTWFDRTFEAAWGEEGEEMPTCWNRVCTEAGIED